MRGGRPHIDEDHVGIVAALKQPVGACDPTLVQRRRERRRPHLALRKAELLAIRGPLLNAAVENGSLPMTQMFEHPEQARGMESALIVVEYDLSVLADPAAAKELGQPLVREPRALDMGVRVVHSVGGDTERSRDMAGIVIGRRPDIDDTHIVTLEHVIESGGRYQQVGIAVVRRVGADHSTGGDRDRDHCTGNKLPRMHHDTFLQLGVGAGKILGR